MINYTIVYLLAFRRYLKTHGIPDIPSDLVGPFAALERQRCRQRFIRAAIESPNPLCEIYLAHYVNYLDTVICLNPTLGAQHPVLCMSPALGKQDSRPAAYTLGKQDSCLAAYTLGAQDSRPAAYTLGKQDSRPAAYTRPVGIHAVIHHHKSDALQFCRRIHDHRHTTLAISAFSPNYGRGVTFDSALILGTRWHIYPDEVLTLVNVPIDLLPGTFIIFHLPRLLGNPYQTYLATRGPHWQIIPKGYTLESIGSALGSATLRVAQVKPPPPLGSALGSATLRVVHVNTPPPLGSATLRVAHVFHNKHIASPSTPSTKIPA